MKVLVTGGTGFLGRRVVRLLAEDDHEVKCLVRGTSDVSGLRRYLGEERWRRVEIVRAELNEASACRAAVQGVDVVYHLAAGLSGSTAALFLTTVVPSRAFVRTCAEEGVGRFVLVSSLGVYGPQGLRSGAQLDENCPTDPTPEKRDPYTFSKIMQERACCEVARERGLDIVIVRPGVIIGPGRGAISSRVGLQFAGLMLRIGGSRQVPYTYVDNCAAAVKMAGLAPDISGECINILDDDLPTVRGVLRAYRAEGRRLRSIWLPQWFIGPLSTVYEAYHNYSRGQLPGVMTRYRTDAQWKPLVFSNEKAKSILGWRPRIGMSEALRESIRSAQPDDI